MKYDDVIKSSNLANLAETKMSVMAASYQLDASTLGSSKLPTGSYGMQQDRITEAPPTDLVDVESMLNNRYDILGRSGYVYKGQDLDTVAPVHLTKPNRRSVQQPPVNFFQQESDRDYKRFNKKGNEQLNMWREDIVTASQPQLPRVEYNDTRAAIKDQLSECK